MPHDLMAGTTCDGNCPFLCASSPSTIYSTKTLLLDTAINTCLIYTSPLTLCSLYKYFYLKWHTRKLFSMPEGGVGEEKEEVSHGQIHPLKTTVHKIKST